MFNRNALYLIRYDTRFTWSLVAVFIGLQTVFLVPSIFDGEQYPDHYDTVLPYVFSCDVWDLPPERDGQNTRNPLTWWLRCASFTYTDNPDLFLMPFGIAIMPLTYMLGSAISKDRLVGLIALSALVFNPLWRNWVDTQTYDMFWAFLVLASVYLIIKGHESRSILVYALALGAKSGSILYLPMWLYHSWSKSKVGILAMCCMLAVSLIFVAFDNDLSDFARQMVGNEIGFYPERFTESLSRIVSMLWPVFPFLFGGIILYMFFKPKEQLPGARDVFVWIGYSLLTIPIIHVFTLQSQYPYRFVILGVFISILLGMAIINTGRFITETRQKKFLVK